MPDPNVPTVAQSAAVTPLASPGDPSTPVTIPGAPASLAPSAEGPSRWAIALVLGTMVLATMLFIMGFTTGAILGLLAGAAGLGLAIVDRLGHKGGS